MRTPDPRASSLPGGPRPAQGGEAIGIVGGAVLERRVQPGVRVVVVPAAAGPDAASMRGTPPSGPVAIELWFLAGTSAERATEHGCAHLLEHMLFKPTTAGRAGPRDIASAIESLGGDVNAFTSHDETVFHATVPANTLPAALESLVAPLVRPAFDPDELARERSVVVEEIKQYDDDPASSAYQDLMELLYGEHSYARPVLGTAREVLGHDAARLRRFHGQLYTADRAILVVVGPVEPSAVFDQAKRLLADLPPRGRVLRPERPEAPRRSRVHVRVDDVHEVQLAFGWQGPPIPAPEACALDIAAVVLGYGEASRLETQTRRGARAVTDAHAGFYASRFSSSFAVTANTTPKRLEPAVAAVLAQVEQLREIPIEDEELRRARAVLRSDVVYRRETVQGLAHAIGYQLSLTGDLDGERQYFEALDAVTGDAVRRACDEYLAPARAALAAVVPTKSAGGGAGEVRTRLLQTLAQGRARAKRPPVKTRRGIKCIDLPSGLRIRAIVDRTVPVGAGWLVWPGGLRLEQTRDAGANALTAELLTRGCDAIDGPALAREIDGHAAVLEGFAGRNSMGLHFECLAANVSSVLRRALECALAPTFEPEELDEERRVALEDLAAERDDLAGLAYRRAFEALYRGHPFGRRRRGSKTSLERIRSARLRAAWGHDYPIGRAVLGVCGDVDLDAVAALCQAMVPGGPPPPPRPDFPGGPPKYPRRPIAKTTVRRREQAHFALAWPGLTLADRRVYALDVLVAVLGGQAGRLFEALRERRGLVYHVAASSAEGLDAGHVCIYGATSNAQRDEALAAVDAELDALRRSGPSPAELDRAKARLIGQHDVEMQRRSRVASLLAFEEALELPLGNHRGYRKKIAKVSASALRALAEELFVPGRRVTSMVTED